VTAAGPGTRFAHRRPRAPSLGDAVTTLGVGTRSPTGATAADGGARPTGGHSHAARRAQATHRRLAWSARCTGLLAVLAALAGCNDRPTGTATVANDASASAASAPLPGPGAQAAAVARLTRNGQPIYCGRGHQRLVALTFDDGPGRYTGFALDELRRAGARATFFLVGRSVRRFGTWPRRERELAAIGEHTMTHANLPTLTRAAARAEISGGRRTARHAAGIPITLFRPPYGAHDRAIDDEVRREGMAEILWDVDSTDSRVSPPANFHEISAHVRKRARPGSIILLHENRGQTTRALRSILPALRRRHLRAVTVPELLAADPPSASQLDAGLRGCRLGWRPPS
jgi:peptidoglycan/xylan/chitin deacetylase (PgdA/CDA1 family)